jgi:hypothetical protein
VDREVTTDATKAAIRNETRMVEEARAVDCGVSVFEESVSEMKEAAGVVEVGRGAESAPGQRAPTIHFEHPSVVTLLSGRPKKPSLHPTHPPSTFNSPPSHTSATHWSVSKSSA